MREALGKFRARLAGKHALKAEYDPLEHERKDLEGVSAPKRIRGTREKANLDRRPERNAELFAIPSPDPLSTIE